MPVGCLVCSEHAWPIEQMTLIARPGVICGLCGGVVFLAIDEIPTCQSCGERIEDVGDGVKLCNGEIRHAVCKRALTNDR
jgi:hypothetical protein